MKPKRLRDIDARSCAIEDEFDKGVSDARSPEFAALTERLVALLRECVELGRLLPTGAPERRRLQGLVDHWTTRLLQAGRPQPEIDRIAPFDPAAGEPLADELFPYQGLQAIGDPERLLGRDAQVREYTRHLERRTGLLVQSESGGGKSSLVLAGVLPALRAAHADWLFAPVLTPGTRPLEALRSAIERALGLTLAATGDALALAAAARAALQGRTLVVCVDQLEELLTLADDAREQAGFCTVLAALAEHAGTRVLATLRIDHYERLAHSPQCRPLFMLLVRDGSLKTLLPMSLPELRSVVQVPAERVGLRFVPPELVDRLASEAAAAGSGLPLLQFALQRLWYERPRDERSGQPLDRIDEATYAKLPNVGGALAAVAARFYDDAVQRGLRDALRRLMLELTVIDERLEVPLRRRRARRELEEVLVTSGLADATQVAWLLDGLVAERVLVQTGSGDARQLEVAHEALFRHWAQFQDWLASENVRVTLREMRQIARDAIAWEHGARSPDLLKLRGQPLDAAQRYLRERWLEPAAQRYVQACAAEAQAQRQRLESGRRAQRSARHARVAFAAVSWALLTLIGLWAWVGRMQSQENTTLTTAAAALVSDIDRLEALDLAYAVKDRSLAPLAHALDRLGDAQLIFPRADGRASFTPSGHAAMQLVRDATTQQLVEARLQVLEGGARRLDPQGYFRVPLAAANGEQFATLDVGPPMRDAHGPRQPEQRLVVAHWVATRNGVGAFTRSAVWRITRGARDAELLRSAELPPEVTLVSDLAFHTDGAGFVAVLRQDRPQQPVTTLRHWRPLSEPPDDAMRAAAGGLAITAVAIAPDGLMVTGYEDGTVRCGSTLIRPPPDGRSPARGGGHDDSPGPPPAPIQALRVAPDSHAVVAVDAAHRITAGHCASGKSVLVLGETVRPEQLAFHPAIQGPDGDSRPMVTYTVRRKAACRHVDLERAEAPPAGARCWAPPGRVTGALQLPHEPGAGPAYTLLADTDAPLLIRAAAAPSAGSPGVAAAAGLPVLKPGHNGLGLPAASPNGQYVLRMTAGESPAAQKSLQLAGPRGTVPVPGALGVAVSDQGRVAWLGGGERGLEFRLLGADGADLVPPMGAPQDAQCMKASPDGRLVLVAGQRREFTVYAIQADGRVLEHRAAKALHAPGAGVTACAIGNEPGPGRGARIALASNDGLVVTTIGTGERLEVVSELSAFRSSEPVRDVAIDAQGRFVAVLGEVGDHGCRPGERGHELRIFDLEHPMRAVPVASTCLAEGADALGALQRREGRSGEAGEAGEAGEPGDAGWTLPVFRAQRGTVLREDYRCRACGADERRAAGALLRAAQAFEPRQLAKERARALFGFWPG